MKLFGRKTLHDAIPFGQFSAERLHRLLRQDILSSIKRLKTLAQSEEAPTFMNTILELESIKSHANRYYDVYAAQTSVTTKNSFSAIADRVNGLLARYEKSLYVPEIFARIEKVYKSSDPNLLTEEDEALILYYYNLYVKEGINLSLVQRKKLAIYEKELHKLGEKYTNNLVKIQDSTMKIRSPEHLQGVSKYFLNVAKRDARKNAYDGYLFKVNDNAYKEILKYCDNRLIRERVCQIHWNSEQNKYLKSNEQIAKRMLTLRQKIAHLHNHKNFSDLTLAFNSVPNFTQLNDIFMKVKKELAPRMKKLYTELENFAYQKDGIEDFSHWDFDYYLHQLKIKKFGLDEQKISEFFPLEHVQNEMFKILKSMFGITFKRTRVPVYHKDVIPYRVFKGKEELGLVYFDLLARPDKDLVPFCLSMNDSLTSKKPHAIVSCQINPPNKDIPSLLSYDDVQTLFHEVGHMLHMMFSKVPYSSLAGFNVSKDFEEVPSLFLEKMVEDPEIFVRLSKHYKTKRPLSKKLVKFVNRFNKMEKLVDVFSTLRYSLLDANFHRSNLIDVKNFNKFEKTVLKDLELFSRPVGSNYLSNFEHLFNISHEGSYYSYLWADIIQEDLWAQFKRNGKRLNRKMANRLVENIFSKGGAVSEMEQIKRFKNGRELSLAPFLKSIRMP